MKQWTIFLILLLVFFVEASVAYAAETRKGTVKAVDEKGGVITFCPEGTNENMTLKAEKGIDLKMLKPDSKVEVTEEQCMVRFFRILPKPAKPAVGC
ncbi:MAG: hypothetical protein M0042_06120 [Nitrospiraceae bacterium]|nr:hypothetical protein [Nitrospiraceae bacterium]